MDEIKLSRGKKNSGKRSKFLLRILILVAQNKASFFPLFLYVFHHHEKFGSLVIHTATSSVVANAFLITVNVDADRAVFQRAIEPSRRRSDIRELTKTRQT